MKLKMQITTVTDQVLVTTVELASMDMVVAVKKAAIAFGLSMSDIREAHTVTV